MTGKNKDYPSSMDLSWAMICTLSGSFLVYLYGVKIPAERLIFDALEVELPGLTKLVIGVAGPLFAGITGCLMLIGVGYSLWSKKAWARVSVLVISIIGLLGYYLGVSLPLASLNEKIMEGAGI